MRSSKIPNLVNSRVGGSPYSACPLRIPGQGQVDSESLKHYWHSDLMWSAKKASFFLLSPKKPKVSWRCLIPSLLTFSPTACSLSARPPNVADRRRSTFSSSQLLEQTRPGDRRLYIDVVALGEAPLQRVVQSPVTSISSLDPE